MPHHAPPSPRPSVQFLPTLSAFIFDAGVAREASGLVRANGESSGVSMGGMRNVSQNLMEESIIKAQIRNEMHALFASNEQDAPNASSIASDVAYAGMTPRGFIRVYEESPQRTSLEYSPKNTIHLNAMSKTITQRHKEMDPKIAYYENVQKMRNRPMRRYASVGVASSSMSPRKNTGRKSARRHSAASIMQVQVKKRKTPASNQVKKTHAGIDAGMASSMESSDTQASTSTAESKQIPVHVPKAPKSSKRPKKPTVKRKVSSRVSTAHRASSSSYASKIPQSPRPSPQMQRTSVSPSQSPPLDADSETTPMRPMLVHEGSSPRMHPEALLNEPQSARPSTSNKVRRRQSHNTPRSDRALMEATLDRFNHPERRPQSARNRSRRRFSPNHLVHSLQKINSERQQEEPLLSFDFTKHTLQEVYANHERRKDAPSRKSSNSSQNAPHNDSHVPVLNFGLLNVSQKSLSAREKSLSARMHSSRSKTAQSHRERTADPLSVPIISHPPIPHSARPRSTSATRSKKRSKSMLLPPDIHYIPFTEIVSESARETPSPTPSRGTPSRLGSRHFLFFYRLITAEQWRRVFMYLEGSDLYNCSFACDFFSHTIMHQDFFRPRLQLRKREHMYYIVSREGRTSDVSLSRLSKLQRMTYRVEPSDFVSLAQCLKEKLSLAQKNTVKQVIFVIFQHRMHKINTVLMEKCLQRDDFLDLFLDYDVSDMPEATFSMVEHFVCHRTEDYSLEASTKTAEVDKNVRHLLDTFNLWLEIQCQLYKCEKMLMLENRIKNIEEWLKDDQKRMTSRPMVVGDDAMTNNGSR